MILLNFISVTCQNICYLLTNDKSNKKIELLKTYLRLRLKYLIFIKILKKDLKKERIFGFYINFLDYRTFIYLFEEMFIRKPYFFKNSTENPFIIDCGSNIGISVIFFKILYPKSEIIAFEPHKKTFDILKMNIIQNNITNVRLNNKAVNNVEGTVDLYLDNLQNDPFGPLTMSIINNNPEVNKENVQSVLLSNFIDKPVDFLKMDIEGVEDLVIEELSIQNKIRLIRQITVEYHHHLNKDKDDLSKILKILEDNNFSYQINSNLNQPNVKDQFQDIMIFAFQK